MTNVALICAEKILRKRVQEIIYLVGRDEQNKKIYKHIILGNNTYLPYFYISRRTYSELSHILQRQKKYNVRYSYNTPKFYLGGSTVKVICPSTRKASELDKLIRKLHHTTYEADMARSGRIAKKYLIDKGIYSGFVLDTLEPVDMVRHYRAFMFDIESLSGLTRIHPESDDPIIVLGFYDNYTNEYIQIYQGADITNTDISSVLVKCDSEKELLLKFVEYVQNRDPDVLIAFNLYGYDLRKLLYRMTVNNIPTKTLSPFKRVFKVEGGRWKIWGRLLFDQLIAYKELTGRELKRYDLEHIIEEEQLPVKKIVIDRPFNEVWSTNPELIIHRNYNDLKAMVLLEDKCKILAFFEEVSRVVGLRLDDCISRKRIIDTMLLRLFNNKLVFPSERGLYKLEESMMLESIGREEKKYLRGAVVFEPKAGIYTNVALYDLKEIYPSIMLAFNISPDTLDQRLGEIVIDDEHKFLSHKQREGVMVTLVKFFRELRNKKRVLRENAKTEDEYNRYTREENAIKYTENAVYGVTDFDNFRLCDRRPCTRIIDGKPQTVSVNRTAEAVTMIGREIVTWIKNKAEERGYNVLYGDTDSVFIHLPDTSSVLDTAQEVEQYLNNTLREYEQSKGLTQEYFTIKLKSIYSHFWLGEVKKQYAGIVTWKGKDTYKIDIVGLEIVRSDASEVEREAMELSLMKLLTDIDVDSKIQKLLDDTKHGKHNPLRVAYPFGIKRKLEKSEIEYGRIKEVTNKNKQMTLDMVGINTVNQLIAIPSHIKASITSNILLHTEYSTGSKAMRLPLDNKKLPEKYKQITTTYTHLLKRKGPVKCTISYKVTDIAIDPYLQLPDWIINAIDWDRIYKRLSGKVSKILREKRIK